MARTSGNFQTVFLAKPIHGAVLITNQPARRADPGHAVRRLQNRRHGRFDIFQPGRDDETVALLHEHAPAPGARPHPVLRILRNTPHEQI